MARAAHVKVTSKETHGQVDRMIRRFIKKVKKERVLEDFKDRRHYKKTIRGQKRKTHSRRAATIAR